MTPLPLPHPAYLVRSLGVRQMHDPPALDHALDHTLDPALDPALDHALDHAYLVCIPPSLALPIGAYLVCLPHSLALPNCECWCPPGVHDPVAHAYLVCMTPLVHAHLMCMTPPGTNLL